MAYTMRLLLPALLLAAMPAAAEQQEMIIEREVYTVPAWDIAAELSDVEELYASRKEYTAAAADDRFVFEKLRYRSEGLEVVAYLYRSRDERSRPVIVFNRGSFVRGDIAPELLAMFHRLALDGFSIIAPMYRGSDGGEGKDEMGGADLADLMNVEKLIGTLPFLDSRNIFLYGESRGGMMVFQALRDGFPARAAATYGAFTDLAGMVSGEQGLAMANAIWPDFAEHRDRIIARRSAIQWPEQLEVPLLLMHGSDDQSVDPLQTLMLASALAKAQQEFGVIVFPGGNHVLTDYRTERDRQAAAFFRRQMTQ
jgi:dipeptidyl aminopeptidase/acylaminoacyl peptidase